MDIQLERRKKIVIANWKMHGGRTETRVRLDALCGGLPGGARDVAVVVCVPFPYLAQTEARLSTSHIAWGVQDISEEALGAYTGEVSAQMAAEFGCRYAIVGHSERRTRHAESSRVIALKARRAIENGITPIVCVGETLAQRETGLTEQVVSSQLIDVIDTLDELERAQVVVAYEPIWAIGTGKHASPDEAQRVHAYIRRLLQRRSETLAKIALLYGGSVKASNATDLFGKHDIDGALVGSASLDGSEFTAICAAAHRAH